MLVGEGMKYSTMVRDANTYCSCVILKLVLKLTVELDLELEYFLSSRCSWDEDAHKHKARPLGA